MAIIPTNKDWKQVNDGDSLGTISSSWGIDLRGNRGSVGVSNPLKKILDETDDSDINNPVAKYLQYDGKVWAISNNQYKSSFGYATDITDGANWSKDTTSDVPTSGATVTDAVVFNNLLLVQDSTDIWAYNGSTWTSWWKGTLGQASLIIGGQFLLIVGADGNLYITDDEQKVYRVDNDGTTVTKTDEGTLDFSATSFNLNTVTKTSTRLFYGTEDIEGENCAIIEWDMGAQSISANKIHRMGTKRVLVMMTWNDTPIAILSDGSIKYYNGASFVDWEGAKLPKTNNPYDDDVIHKNGWAIIDDLPHVLINPKVNTSADTTEEITSNYWDYPAGIYCLDPKVGLYCRYSLTDGTSQQRQINTPGALFSLDHEKTNFLTSYDFRPTTTTIKAIFTAEDREVESASIAWLNLQPLESIAEIIKKITLVHKRLGTGDEINVYYRRHDDDSVRITGNWLNSTTFNTTDDTTRIEKGDIGFTKLSGHFMSKVNNISGTGTVSIEFNEANTNVTDNDAGILEIVNFKSMGSVKAGVEISPLTIPQPVKSRQVWVMIELKQAAGNNIQLDYLISE